MNLCDEMELKDLIGHKIIDISDNVSLLIKTDKGIYELGFGTFQDGSLSEVFVEKSNESTWNCWSR